MDIKRELNNRLFMQREENTTHLDYEREFSFYRAIATGDTAAVEAGLKNYYENDSYQTTSERNGDLSKNPLQNYKFHFVIMAAMVSRFCVDAGLDREISYTMSDIYIQRVDLCTTIEQVHQLQHTMIMDYTKRMQDNRKKDVYSKPIMKCIDYIYNNLNRRLYVSDIAEYLGVTPAYLSRLFSKEVKQPLSSYIKEHRLIAAANMLQYSDYTISEIAEIFGFSSQSHFTSAFQEQYNTTPKKYRDEFSKKSMPSK